MKLNLNTVITNINTNNSALLMFLLARKILPLLIYWSAVPNSLPKIILVNMHFSLGEGYGRPRLSLWM